MLVIRNTQKWPSPHYNGAVKRVAIKKKLFFFFVAYIHVCLLTLYKSINYKPDFYKVCK